MSIADTGVKILGTGWSLNLASGEWGLITAFTPLFFIDPPSGGFFWPKRVAQIGAEKGWALAKSKILLGILCFAKNINSL